MSRNISSTRAALAAVFFCALSIVFGHAFPVRFNPEETAPFRGVDLIVNEVDSDTPSTDVAEFVELGGKVLGPMIKRIAPAAKVTSVATIEDIEALAKEIA